MSNFGERSCCVAARREVCWRRTGRIYRGPVGTLGPGRADFSRHDRDAYERVQPRNGTRHTPRLHRRRWLPDTSNSLSHVLGYLLSGTNTLCLPSWRNSCSLFQSQFLLTLTAAKARRTSTWSNRAFLLRLLPVYCHGGYSQMNRVHKSRRRVSPRKASLSDARMVRSFSCDLQDARPYRLFSPRRVHLSNRLPHLPLLDVTLALGGHLRGQLHPPRPRAHSRLSMSPVLASSRPLDRKSTRLNSSHSGESRMPSSA